MARYLVALIWLAGIALIFGAALGVNVRLPARSLAAGSGPFSGWQRGREGPAAGAPFRVAVAESARLIAVCAAGAVAVFGVMWVIGIGVVHNGLTIDRPVFTWLSTHQVHVVAAAMKRLTKIGDTWTTWGAAAGAAVCLAVTWRRKRWLPPLALASAIVIDHYTTIALRHTFHRIGPPTSPLGTYPSGGADRCVVFYGLIAYLLWREFSGQRRAAIWAGAAVAAVSFSEAYSRVYLSLHWLTDALSGLLYGALLLMVFIIAVRAVAGPAPAAADSPADDGVAVSASAPTAGGPPA